MTLTLDVMLRMDSESTLPIVGGGGGWGERSNHPAGMGLGLGGLQREQP